MSYVEELLKKSTVLNSKGGEYYHTTHSYNLDLFSGLSRSMPKETVEKMFNLAFLENKELAVANILYLLDIRNGKGERRLFKICFKWLCEYNTEYAKKVLKFIGELGRYDYILEGIGTNIEDDVIDLINKQLSSDYMNYENPSLLAKWLPTRKRVNDEYNYPKIICEKLNITREDYRHILVHIRKKLNLIETKLAQKDYNINFEVVPTKAMLKYRKAFDRNCKEIYNEYLEKANNGETKINTKGLFAYEIVSKIYEKNVSKDDTKLFNAMWEQQKDILNGYDKNILVMADTSGSMTWGGKPEPIYSSIGLALYIAERNNGAFKDYFMTFSSRPLLQKVKGDNIVSKVKTIRSINQDTNIDKAFELLLNTAKENNISSEEMPTHIIILSDMEFDSGVYSKGGTNFDGWKKAFKENNYEMPKIIFWNLSNNTLGYPTTKFENDVAMISGFSTSILENLLDIENFTPENIMFKKLQIYIELLRELDE